MGMSNKIIRKYKFKKSLLALISETFKKCIKNCKPYFQVHIAGHRGIKGNEEADKLARQGALRYRKT